MKKQEKILAIDLGSTAFKTAVFDMSLQKQAEGAARLDYRYAPGGRIELQVDHVEQSCRAAISQALESANVDADELAALAITSQAQTFTLLDQNDTAKMPFISWQDTRAGAACEMLQADPTLSDFARHSSFGQILDALQICQIRFLQETQPGFIKPTDQILKLPSWLVHRLSGRARLDQNLAAMSGLYSMSLGDWWPEALSACRLERSQLPELVKIGTVAAQTSQAAQGWGIPAGLPIVLAGNDQTAGAFGAELETVCHPQKEVVPGTNGSAALVTLGTAHVVYACGPIDVEPGEKVIRGPYPGGLHYRLAADSCGGNVVDWARTVLAGCESVEAFYEAVARGEPGCHGATFNAELPSDTGGWSGVGMHHGRDDLARAVIESLNERIAQMIEWLKINPADSAILVAGGGSRSRVWVDMLSDRLGTELKRTEADPLRGAARMAF